MAFPPRVPSRVHVHPRYLHHLVLFGGRVEPDPRAARGPRAVARREVQDAAGGRVAHGVGQGAGSAVSAEQEEAAAGPSGGDPRAVPAQLSDPVITVLLAGGARTSLEGVLGFSTCSCRWRSWKASDEMRSFQARHAQRSTSQRPGRRPHEHLVDQIVRHRPRGCRYLLLGLSRRVIGRRRHVGATTFLHAEATQPPCALRINLPADRFTGKRELTPRSRTICVYLGWNLLEIDLGIGDPYCCARSRFSLHCPSCAKAPLYFGSESIVRYVYLASIHIEQLNDWFK
jgi:hypothetical protein